MQPGAEGRIAACHCIGCNAVRTRHRRRLRLHSAARRRLLELLGRRSVCLLRGGEITRLQRGAELVEQFLVRLLSKQVGHTVVDKTGLAGSYEFTLQWKPDDSAAGQTPTFGGAQGTAGTALWPSIFTAIQEQLGLEQEPQEVSMEVLVIDYVEQPVEN